MVPAGIIIQGGPIQQKKTRDCLRRLLVGVSCNTGLGWWSCHWNILAGWRVGSVRGSTQISHPVLHLVQHPVLNWFSRIDWLARQSWRGSSKGKTRLLWERSKARMVPTRLMFPSETIARNHTNEASLHMYLPFLESLLALFYCWLTWPLTLTCILFMFSFTVCYLFLSNSVFSIYCYYN